ncbi:MAG: hypothetical protein AUH92_03185 [Acidobacteria bacterium 13_1_40CM_4_69_4]|nr:MAG: hypothetical protein AUH92_03185 [Acidobacteria bacterium 13_1_40CM_4_69_4]
MTPFERGLLHASTWLVAASGGAYFCMKYMMTGGGEFSVIHHPWQPGALSLHVLAGPVMVFALGLIARDHIIDRLGDPRQRRGRGSGIAIVALALPMIASGYLMQVATDPAARRALVGVHLVGGALYLLLFAGHLVVSRNGRRRAEDERGAARRIRGGARRPRLDRPGPRGIG